MTDVETAWLAGILEGEGYFGISMKRSRGGSTYPTWIVRVNMTDRDVLDRVRSIAGVGSPIRGVEQPNPKWRTQYTWVVYRRADVERLIRAVRPYMGERRGARIDEMLASMADRPPYEVKHGTRTGYENHRCRCAVCRGGHAARFRARRAA